MGHILQILPDIQNHAQTDIEWYFVSIRDRLKWISTMGHERCLLLKRRYDGQRCPFFDTTRKTNQQHGFDTICYGTGFINPNTNLSLTPGYSSTNPTAIALPDGMGGYFHSIEITASFLHTGYKPVNTKEGGWQENQLALASWTLWEPTLNTGDILVRRDNRRYIITQVDPRRFKHYITHQTFDFAELEKNHPIFSMPLETV